MMKTANDSHKKPNIKRFGILSLILFCLTQFCCSNPFTIADYAILPSIKDFTVINENEAWLVKQNGKILVFNNNNQPINKPEFADKIVQIYFLNKNEGWALEENGQLWATTDNGKIWHKKALLTKESPALLSSHLIFADSEVGWLTSSFTVWLTQDGGDSWTMVFPSGQFKYDSLKGLPMNITVVDKDIVWLGFENGGLLKTIDRGNSWEQLTLPARIDIDALYAFDADRCFVSGRGEKRGLFYTGDGGRNWKDVLPTEISRNLGINSITFIDKKIGWAAGLNFVTNIDEPANDIDVLIKTIDGGKTWVKVDTNINENHGLTRVKFTDKENGWLTGERAIYQTKDGGSSWTKIFEVEDYNQRAK